MKAGSEAFLTVLKGGSGNPCVCEEAVGWLGGDVSPWVSLDASPSGLAQSPAAAFKKQTSRLPQ